MQHFAIFSKINTSRAKYKNHAHAQQVYSISYITLYYTFIAIMPCVMCTYVSKKKMLSFYCRKKKKKPLLHNHHVLYNTYASQRSASSHIYFTLWHTARCCGADSIVECNSLSHIINTIYDGAEQTVFLCVWCNTRNILRMHQPHI